MTTVSPPALEGSHAALDQSTPVPLYHQLRQSLEQSWRGQYGAEDDLPTEQEIMDRYKISRITVRRALDDLMADGVIYRPRARGRLRWAPQKVKQQLSRLRGFFSHHAMMAGLHPSTRVLEFAQGSWPEATRLLRLEEGATCYRIARLHESDGKPLSHQVSYIPRHAGPDPTLADLAGSVLRMVEQQTGRTASRAEQRLSAREATAQELTLLQLPPRSHVFQVEWLMCDKDGVPLEYFISALDISRYEFLSTIHADVDDEDPGGHSPWAVKA